ncbi:MAG: AAA family ATPase, partial [Gemmatimonadaceae bacterium]|nr:AAA family ATPase [Gemmatimonadaceae bacterium]
MSPDSLAEQGTSSVQAARLSRQPVSLLIIEVDRFELIDRTHGAQYAEHVLATVAMLVRDTLRPRDVVARRSAHELAALLTGLPLPQAVELAERIATAVREHEFVGGSDGRPVPVRVSVGVATAPVHAEAYPALVAAAERALHRLARAGGDGVEAALDPAMEPSHPPLDVDRFVGRNDQLRTLVRMLDDAMLGRGQVAVVHGEIGVGCSTLIAQLAPEVAVRGGSFVRGSARRLPVRPPYGPLADVIDELRRLPGAPAGDWRELQHLVPALAASESAESGGGSQFRLLEELSAFITTAAASRPLVLVFDDMQWADEHTWDAIEHVLPKLVDAPVMLAVVLRDDPSDPVALDRRKRLAGTEGAHDITVSRLTRDEVKRWVEAAFHRQEVGREFLSFIYRNTEGNPLFVDQLLRALVEEGAVWHTGERWEWRPVSELQVPSSIDALVVRRLARFAPRAQVALAAAAVL